MLVTRFKIHNVIVDVGSNNEAFLNFVKKYFEGFSIVRDSGEAQVIVECKFESGFSFKINRNYTHQAPVVFGENVAYDPSNHRFVFAHREVLGDLDIGADKWAMKATFKKNFFRHFSNLLFFKGSLTNEHYYRFLTRLLIQNLLFMKLEQNKEISIHSGAAIAVNGQAYVFFGLPGSGKSTLLAKIKSNIADAEILAHNFVLVKGNMNLIYPEGFARPMNREYPIKNIFINGYGDRFNSASLSLDEAISNITAINQFTAELPVHSIFANLVLADAKFDFIFNEPNLTKLLATIPAVKLIVDRGHKEFLNYFRANVGN
jgi:hypothetical protein